MSRMPSPNASKPLQGSKAPFRPDLIWDSRLLTEFLPNGVLRHTYFKSDSANGQRQVRHAEKWTTKMKVGEGGFGRVWFQTNEAGDVRALKEIRKDMAPAPIDYRRELEAAFKFSHSKYVHCFVESFGWFEDEKNVYISMEYLQHGDLRNVLNAAALSEDETQILTRQLVEGLQMMHSNHFVHRDLKPANILVVQPGPRWWIKISDFGISKRAYEATALRTSIGTEGYCAPEVLIGSVSNMDNESGEQEEAYTAAVDMWALGEIVYRCLTQKPAFPSRRDMYLFVTNQKPLNEEPLLRRGTTEPCRDFVKGLLAAIPGERYNADAAASHNWVKLPGIVVEPASPSLKSEAQESQQQWELSPIEGGHSHMHGTAAWSTLQDLRHPQVSLLVPVPQAVPVAYHRQMLPHEEQRRDSLDSSKPASPHADHEPVWYTAVSRQDANATPRPIERQQKRPFNPMRDVEPKSIRPTPSIPRVLSPRQPVVPDPEKEKLKQQIALLQAELGQTRQERDIAARERARAELKDMELKAAREAVERLERQRYEAAQREEAARLERMRLQEEAERLELEKREAEIREAERFELEMKKIAAKEEEKRREEIRLQEEKAEADREKREAELKAKKEEEEEQKRRSMIAELVRAELKEQEKKEWMSKSKGQRALLRWITKKDPEKS